MEPLWPVESTIHEQGVSGSRGLTHHPHVSCCKAKGCVRCWDRDMLGEWNSMGPSTCCVLPSSPCWALWAAWSCSCEDARTQIAPEALQGLIYIHTSPLTPVLLIACCQHNLNPGSRRGGTFVVPCSSHATSKSPCLVLTGSPWPASLGNATGGVLGTRLDSPAP